MASSAVPPADLSSKLLDQLTRTPDTRRRIHLFNGFAHDLEKLPADAVKMILADAHLPAVLFDTLVKCCDLHHTVKEIGCYVMGLFLSRGPESIGHSFAGSLRDFLASKSPLRRKILQDLMLCRIVCEKVLFTSEVAPVLITFIKELLCNLTFCGVGKWETTAEEVQQVSETLLEVALIARVLEAAPPASVQFKVRCVVFTVS